MNDFVTLYALTSTKDTVSERNLPVETVRSPRRQDKVGRELGFG